MEWEWVGRVCLSGPGWAVKAVQRYRNTAKEASGGLDFLVVLQFPVTHNFGSPQFEVF